MKTNLVERMLERSRTERKSVETPTFQTYATYVPDLQSSISSATSTLTAPHGEEARPLMKKVALPTTGGTYKDFTKRVETLKTQLPTLIKDPAFTNRRYLRELANEIRSAEPVVGSKTKDKENRTALQLRLQSLSQRKKVDPEAKSTVDLINDGLLAIWHIGERGIAQVVLLSLESKVAETTKP